MVEETFSMDMLDDILDTAKNPHDGSYTAVGVYDHQELIDMVAALSEKSGIPIDDLVQAFVTHLMGRFKVLYPFFFQDKNNSFEFLEGIEDTIHTEVRKLYPSAELPQIDWIRIDEKSMEIHYSSNRPFSALAVGLIKGCMSHFQEEANISMEGNANKAVITIKKLS
jgi:hypothetical protein